jgi:hypothetical protein
MVSISGTRTLRNKQRGTETPSGFVMGEGLGAVMEILHAHPKGCIINASNMLTRKSITQTFVKQGVHSVTKEAENRMLGPKRNTVCNRIVYSKMSYVYLI